MRLLDRIEKRALGDAATASYSNINTQTTHTGTYTDIDTVAWVGCTWLFRPRGQSPAWLSGCFQLPQQQGENGEQGRWRVEQVDARRQPHPQKMMSRAFCEQEQRG